MHFLQTPSSVFSTTGMRAACHHTFVTIKTRKSKTITEMMGIISLIAASGVPDALASGNIVYYRNISSPSKVRYRPPHGTFCIIQACLWFSWAQASAVQERGKHVVVFDYRSWPYGNFLEKCHQLEVPCPNAVGFQLMAKYVVCS